MSELKHVNYKSQEKYAALSTKDAETLYFVEFKGGTGITLSGSSISVDTSVIATQLDIQSVMEVAEGKTKTYITNKTLESDFNSQNDTITISKSSISLENSETVDVADLKPGDVFLLSDTNIPDRWVKSTTSSSVTLGKLETVSIDLNAYALKNNPVFTGTTFSFGQKSGTTLGTNAICLGADADATNNYAIAIGNGATVHNGAQYGIAIGYNAVNAGQYSISIGYTAKGNNNQAIAIGYNSKADDMYGIALGQGITNSGPNGIAIGNGSYITSYSDAIAIGRTTRAIRAETVAIGYKAKAESQGAVAIGVSTESMYNYSVALGGSALANANYATAIGAGSKAQAQYSFATSYGTAGGEQSIAIGRGTFASAKDSIVLGTYNVSDTGGSQTTRGTYQLIIGNGTSSSAKSNSLTLDWNGNMWFGGNLQCAGLTDGTTTKTMAQILAGGGGGGSTEPQFFRVTPGTTTFEEIVEKLEEGYIPYAYCDENGDFDDTDLSNNYLFMLDSYSSTCIIFNSYKTFYSSGYMRQYTLYRDSTEEWGGWRHTQNITNIEGTSNKLETISSSDKTNTKKYPSIKAMVDYINNESTIVKTNREATFTVKPKYEAYAELLSSTSSDSTRATVDTTYFSNVAIYVNVLGMQNCTLTVTGKNLKDKTLTLVEVDGLRTFSNLGVKYRESGESLKNLNDEVTLLGDTITLYYGGGPIATGSHFVLQVSTDGSTSEFATIDEVNDAITTAISNAIGGSY